MSNIYVEKIWGGRTIGKLFGKKLPKGKRIGEYWVFCERRYPIIVKLIDVKKPLSVQVHPHGKRGKSELWYIIKAGSESKVLGGITLEKFNIRAGDWVYLSGGTVHTILPPAVLLEISQRNFTTYRLYDWGRGTRPLDIEKGLKNIKINSKPKIYKNINLFRCPYFAIRRMKLKKGEKLNFNGVCFVLKGTVDGIDKGEARLVRGSIQALTNSEVFSVNCTTRSSKTSR